MFTTTTNMPIEVKVVPATCKAYNLFSIEISQSKLNIIPALPKSVKKVYISKREY